MESVDRSFERNLTLWGAGAHSDYVLELLSSLGAVGRVISESEGVSDLQGGADLLIVESRTSERRNLIQAALARGCPLPAALVHPRAWIGLDVSVGDGSVVLSGAQIVTHVSVGQHCIVGANAVISHDCQLGVGVVVGPGALLNGNVTIEDFATIGSGAVVLPGLTVGLGAVVEAGAVVIHSVETGSTVSGCPATPASNPP